MITDANHVSLASLEETSSAGGQDDEKTLPNGDQSQTKPAGIDPPRSPSNTADSQETEPGYELPLDLTFEILKNSRRRETLRYLNSNGGETTLSDVAEHIAALENDTTVREITSTQRKRVYVGLYQCHLPKMDDADVVGFDQNRGTITLGPNASQLDRYLDDSEPRPWNRRYLTVAALGATLFILGEAGPAAFGVGSSALLVLLLVSIAAVAGWHTLELRGWSTD